MRLTAGLALAACLVLACDEPAPRRPPGLPNVLLITLDGLRRDHMPTFGYERDTAPNIDGLAKRGLVFSEIVSPSCSTKISLTSLLTGLDYDRHGVGQNKAALPDELLTLAEIFRSQGYATAGFVGSPWLTSGKNYGQGFDLYEDFLEKKKGNVQAEQVVSAAVEELRKPATLSRPFFYYLHLKEPHPPWIRGSPWLDDSERGTSFFDEGCGYVPTAQELDGIAEATRRDLIAKYDGAIRYADDWIGKLLDALRSLDLESETIIAVSTDHGIELLDRYSGGHGNTPYEEVLRGFLILFDGRGPVAPGEFLQAQGRIFDTGPTLLKLAGLETPTDLDGLDLLGAWQELPEYAFATCYSGQVVRSKKHKLIRFDFSSFPAWEKNPLVGVEEGFVLHDLAADPGERLDVIREQPEVAERMRRVLAAYRGAPDSGQLTREDAESFDRETRERLKAMGYIE